MSLYQPLIPTGTVDLDVDYKNLQNNFNQLDITYKVDHVPLTNNTSQNGYHTAIHLVQQAAPATVPGIGEIFCTNTNDGIGAADEIFFFKTGLGKTYQMTRNFVPVSAVNGRTFLPGGLILQWFLLTNAVSQTLTPVTYAGLGGIAFPTSGFHVQSTIRAGNTTNPITLNISAVTATGFTYFNVSNSVRDFYVLAIGI